MEYILRKIDPKLFSVKLSVEIILVLFKTISHKHIYSKIKQIRNDVITNQDFQHKREEVQI